MHSPAEGGVVSKDSNICPWGGVPVGEIIPLLGALVTITIAIGVLTRVDGAAYTQSIVLLQILVCCEQSYKEKFPLSFLHDLPNISSLKLSLFIHNSLT